jgi:two-component system, cell cycle response regulator
MQFPYTTSRLRMPLAAAILLLAAVVATAAHAAFTVLELGKPGLDAVFNQWVYDGVLIAAGAACALRVILHKEERAAWLSICLGTWFWALGDVYYNAALSHLDEIPYPSFADLLYIAGYPLMLAGIVLLTSARITNFERSDWLDGLIGALAVAAVGAAFIYPALEGATQGDVATVAVNLAYPLGDLLLLSVLVVAVALSGWRADPGWSLFGGGLALVAIADAIYLQQEATVGYTAGSWYDTLWLAGAVAISAAAWTLRRPKPVSAGFWPRLTLPALCALTAVAIVVYDHFERVSHLALLLAGASLVIVVARMILAFDENVRLLRSSRIEALTDPLTTLPNRRSLMNDLVDASADGARQPALFAIFDLDGFKTYNDSFGHVAGDALLARLGQKLAAAIEGYGRAYRLGGDEFCLLAGLDGTSREVLLATAASALSEEGEAFSIASSYGAVLLPEEADSPSEIMRVADRRMYAQKATRANSAQRQSSSVLLRTLEEREPDLGTHLEGVALLASVLARRVGLGREDRDVVVAAAKLHDIGKIAIPDEILRKPGPLEAQEWEVMRTHTLIGERILASAAALVPVARLVRSSHERWDGGGYPDGLAGDEIPLGARIVFVCDAYEAMTADRPWCSPRTPEEALAELRRCAGTQFDPSLVEAFATQVFPELLEPLPLSRS